MSKKLGRDEDLTRRLNDWKQSEEHIPEDLLDLVYERLRVIARGRLRSERQNHTLSTLGLVNETYLKLNESHGVVFKSFRHFQAIVAKTMRQVLVDYARERNADKRWSSFDRLSIDGGVEALPSHPRRMDLTNLNDALTELKRRYPEHALLVELRYFGGLTLEESADVLQISVSHTKRYWAFAKAYLKKLLKE